MRFKSHPDKYLRDHLAEVRAIALENNHGLDDRLVDITASGHDFGKFTTYFQHRLEGTPGDGGPLGDHSYISAVFAAYTAFRLGRSDSEALLVFSAVNSHHSRIKDRDAYLPRRIAVFRKEGVREQETLRRLEMMEKQLEDMQKNKEAIRADLSGLETLHHLDYTGCFEAFLSDREGIKETLCALKRTARALEKKGMDGLFYDHQLLFSLLVSADKLSASNTAPLSPESFPLERLEESRIRYLEDLSRITALPEAGPSPMDPMRGEIYAQVQRAVEAVAEDERIMSITAPTGTGKTLTGFYAAQKLKARYPEIERIIYVLPFTSIIDQNYKVINRLYELSGMTGETADACLMKHHYLTTNEREDPGERYSDSQFQMILEDWEAGTIVTTFIQFLESVIGAGNRMAKKIHAYQNAVVLMDEIQAINCAYLPLIDGVIHGMAQRYNMRIIIMTATRPLFFSHIKELLPDYRRFFSAVNRTQLTASLQPTAVADFCDGFIAGLGDESVMIVVNTIAESLAIYGILSQALGEGKVLYLSTNIIPKARKERIEAVSKLLGREKPILVTTQVVEAGVNLDFDRVIRDLAPMDSIIQCAGRCNRNGAQGRGTIEVRKLVDGSGRAFGGFIYDATSMQITEALLEGCGVIQEKDFLTLIDGYYEQIKQNINPDLSRAYLEGIHTLDFNREHDRPGTFPSLEVGSFSLIKEKDAYVDVYVMTDAEAEVCFEELKQSYRKKSRDQAFLSKLKKKMRQYTLSVPQRLVKNEVELAPITPTFAMYIIRREDLERMYDLLTGLKRSLAEEAYLMF